MNFFRRDKTRPLPDKVKAKEVKRSHVDLVPCAKMSSDGSSPSGTAKCAKEAQPQTSNVASRLDADLALADLLNGMSTSPKPVTCTIQDEQQLSRESPPSPETKRIPINVRVEQEMLRLGLATDSLIDLDTVPPLPGVTAIPKRSRPRTRRPSLPQPISRKNKTPPCQMGTPHLTKDCPIHERVEQEKRRLSGSTSMEEDRVKSTALSLRFKDINGRTIQYNIKPSKKATRATYLELNVEESIISRKVKKLCYDGPTNSIIDGKDGPFYVPPEDIDTVMKSLNLICKITCVRLECKHAPVHLRKILSNLDVTGSTIPRVESSLDLSQRSRGSTLDGSDRSGSNIGMRHSTSMGGLTHITNSRRSSVYSGSMRRVTSGGNLAQSGRMSSMSSGSSSRISSMSAGPKSRKVSRSFTSGSCRVFR